MKCAALVIIIALLLSFPAFAAGNSIEQSNHQQINGAGYSSAIYQSSSNMAIVIGNGNYVNQYNELYSNNAAHLGYVSQDIANSIIADGEANSAYQNNYAYAELLGEMTSITQTQSNLGTITGTGNSMSQLNDAYARLEEQNRSESYSGANAKAFSNATAIGMNPYEDENYSSEYAANSSTFSNYQAPSINQQQTNSGIQQGNNNTLSQTSHEDASIYSYSSTYSGSDSNAYADAYSNAIATGNLSSPYAFAKAYAKALASTDALEFIEPISISQSQSNTAAQTGASNAQTQYNYANASISSNIFANAYSKADAHAHGSDYQVITDGNCPYCNTTANASATASAVITLDSLKVSQDQSNNAIQSGNYSSANQENMGNASIYSYVGANSSSDVSSGALASSEDYMEDSCPNANAIAAADANAIAGAYIAAQYIEQIQSNNGLVVGDSNDLSQSNHATDVINLYAFAGAYDRTSPQASAHGYTEGDLFPSAGAYANATGNAYAKALTHIGANQLADNQSNDASQMGTGNSLTQSNNANSSVYFDLYSHGLDNFSPYAYIDQAGVAYANASYYASSNASVSFSAENIIKKTQENLAMMMSQSDTLAESNNADLNIPGSSFVNLSIIEENSVTLV